MPLPPSSDNTNKFGTEADIQSFLAEDDVKDTNKTEDKDTNKDRDTNKDTNKDKPIEIKDDEDDDKLDLDDEDEKDEEDNKKDDKKNRKSKSKDKDEEDDLDEDDDEDEDEDEDEEEEELDAPPRKKDITAKYPNFFKEFKWFERMMYRDREMMQMFGSFDDAKLSHQKAQILDKFNEDLVSGNTEKVLTGLKQNHPKAFDKVVNNYLRTLYNVDKEAYQDVIANVSRSIIGEVQRFADRKKDDGLKEVAKFLSQFLLDSDEVDTKIRLRKVDDEEKPDKAKELEEKEREFLVKRFETVRDDLDSRVRRVLTNTIADNIDPDGEMTPYMKKVAINDCLERLQKRMSKDPEFMDHLDNLWRAAEKDEFSDASARRIKKFYLGRAKRVLPIALKRTKAEALKDYRPSSRKDDNEEETPRSRNIEAGRPRQNSGKKESLTMKPGESVTDFLMRD